MIGITISGEEVEFLPFQSLVGIRFESIIITGSDMNRNDIEKEKYAEWLVNCVFTRLPPA